MGGLLILQTATATAAAHYFYCDDAYCYTYSNSYYFHSYSRTLMRRTLCPNLRLSSSRLSLIEPGAVPGDKAR